MLIHHSKTGTSNKKIEKCKIPVRKSPQIYTQIYLAGRIQSFLQLKGACAVSSILSITVNSQKRMCITGHLKIMVQYCQRVWMGGGGGGVQMSVVS